MNGVSQKPVVTIMPDTAIAGPDGGDNLTPEVLVEISALALRARRANGPVMTVMNRLGRGIEGQIGSLPPQVQRAVDATLGPLTSGV